MDSTLRMLIDTPELGLIVLAGEELDRPVERTLASELVDPSLLLQGGELVLTTGSRLGENLTALGRYVDRLVSAGAAGLGLGLTDEHPAVPSGLIEAAERSGLPLLAVPSWTSFATVARSVTTYGGGDQRALSFAVDAQRDLSRAMQSPNAAREVVQRLAKALRCWVLLLDADGGLRACTPTGRSHLARIRIDLTRLRDGRRPASLSMTVAGDAVVLLPLAVQGRVRGFLAVGRSTGLTAGEQSVVTTAVSLLCADLRGIWGAADNRRRHRLAVFKVAIEGDIRLAAAVADALGTGCPEGALRVALLGVRRDEATELLERAENDHALRSVCALIAEWEPGRVVVLMPPAEGDVRTLESLLRQVPHARGAVSDAVPPHELPDAWRRVRSVFNSAPGTAGKLALASDVASAGLMRHLTSDEARGWAEAVLAPLADNERTKIDLRHTLRTFLAHNGQADASASALGIHRHTLRYRMGKVAEALGRDLDDPSTRAELWVALQLEDRP